MKFWDDSWRNDLEDNYYSCYIRLCECRNTKSDIALMSTLMYNHNKNIFTAEDCLIRMIEWVGDWNSQWDMTDSISNEEFERMLHKVLTNSN